MKKRFFALFLAVAMTLGMGMSAFAVEGETTPAGNYSITVGQVAGATTTHTYEAYQVFTGDLSEDGKTLSNVAWGANVTGPVVFNNVTYNTAADLAKGLKDADAAAFAQAVTLTGAPVATQTESAIGSGVTFTGLAAGYYIVKDAEGSLAGKNDSYSEYIVQVVGNINITAKADVPSTEKKITDINDTTGETEGPQDSADYDIGDDIPFQFTSTIVDNIANYKNAYVYTFHDTECEGLTFNNDVAITIDGNAYTDFTVVTNASDNCTFEVVTGDLRSVAQKDSKIVVTYTSKLNEKANIGAAGNPNIMKLEYSNNPNGEGTGITPEDKVIAFTYKVEVDKVDENLKPLSGAEFTLQKKVGDAWVDLALVKSDDGDVFTFTGLDDGEYRIAETKTPDGYNTISDAYIPFTVVAQHDKNSEDPKLTSLEGNVATGLVGTYNFAPNTNEGTLKTQIINQSGAILPSTGGIGTTIFYIVGIILVCGAGAVLFVRKRMGNEEV